MPRPYGKSITKLVPTPALTVQLIGCGFILLELVRAQVSTHQTRQANKTREPQVLEMVEPLQVAQWTTNTVERPMDPKIWLVYKEKYLVANWRNQLMKTSEMERLLKTVWVRRVEMLKLKHDCEEHQFGPYAIDERTVDPIVEPHSVSGKISCDEDRYMCANEPRSAHRHEYDRFSQKYKKMKDAMGYGEHGFNKYTLKKTIYMLRIEQNDYRLCNGLPTINITETWDEPLP